jgi:hypothetical protein
MSFKRAKSSEASGVALLERVIVKLQDLEILERVTAQLP